jgi:hypothetical protein
METGLVASVQGSVREVALERALGLAVAMVL